MAKTSAANGKDKDDKKVGWPAMLGGVAALMTALGGLGLAAQKIGWIGTTPSEVKVPAPAVEQRSMGSNSPNLNNIDGSVTIKNTTQP